MGALITHTRRHAIGGAKARTVVVIIQSYSVGFLVTLVTGGSDIELHRGEDKKQPMTQTIATLSRI